MQLNHFLEILWEYWGEFEFDLTYVSAKGNKCFNQDSRLSIDVSAANKFCSRKRFVILRNIGNYILIDELEILPAFIIKLQYIYSNKSISIFTDAFFLRAMIPGISCSAISISRRPYDA